MISPKKKVFQKTDVREEITVAYRKSLQAISINKFKMHHLSDVSFDLLEHLVVAQEDIVF